MFPQFPFPSSDSITPEIFFSRYSSLVKVGPAYLVETQKGNKPKFRIELNPCDRIIAIADKANGIQITGRFYSTPHGILPSVTHIIEKTRDKEEDDRLRKWRHKMSKIHGSQVAETKIEQIRDKGTMVHSLIEAYLNDKPLPIATDESLQLFNLVKPKLDYIKSTTRKDIATESFIYHPYGWAGRLDLKYREPNDDLLRILDFKTSGSVKKRQWMKDAFLQATAYALAESNRINEPIPMFRILVISPTRVQLFEEDVANYQQQWIEKVNQYCETYYDFRKV
jgi:hypothetical protein